jgi:hypothetical protein
LGLDLCNQRGGDGECKGEAGQAGKRFPHLKMASVERTHYKQWFSVEAS